MLGDTLQHGRAHSAQAAASAETPARTAVVHRLGAAEPLSALQQAPFSLTVGTARGALTGSEWTRVLPLQPGCTSVRDLPNTRGTPRRTASTRPRGGWGKPAQHSACAAGRVPDAAGLPAGPARERVLRMRTRRGSGRVGEGTVGEERPRAPGRGQSWSELRARSRTATLLLKSYFCTQT